MSLVNDLALKLESYNLLRHSFYNDWSKGTLSLYILRKYTKQYYYHVAAFPRYISLIHSQCEDINIRQILLANLMEEEKGKDNHPELWLRFADGLVINRSEIRHEDLLKKTNALINGYFELCQESFATGIGALYAYERQVPSVAKLMIHGLKSFYGINKEKNLKYFNVHLKIDEMHTMECAKLIEQLDPKYQTLVCEGAFFGAKLLWQFLDGIQEYNLLLH
ncbi:MAG: CADD family putative folate metabolism protein [Gammaproteobacteria bacterium]